MPDETQPLEAPQNSVIDQLSESFESFTRNDDWQIKTCKKMIRSSQKLMDQNFRDGTNIVEIVEARSWLIDQVLIRCWQRINWPTPITLIAVGGYGRGELHPYSDIDLLILSDAEADKSLQEAISQFIQFLWDISLEVGHAVRTTQQCIELAQSDITVCTNLIESRVLIGEKQYLDTVLTALYSNQTWPGSTFFDAKLEEQNQRHDKYNDTEYNLEPNVKSSPGALRDIHIIAWITRYYYANHSSDGAQSNLSTFVDDELFTWEELTALEDCRQFLWKVRYGLHMLARRSEDRLLFDHQRNLAEIFGYSDNDNQLAVEQFMRDYYNTVGHISDLNEVLLQHFEERIFNAGLPRKTVALNSRFNVCNHYIEVNSEQLFELQPIAILEIFVILAENRELKGITAPTIRLLRRSLELIDDEFRQDRDNGQMFMRLLAAPYSMVTQLQRMQRYGILGQYIPEYGRIIGQMQHDLFHTYTVDAHTLLLMRYLRQFTNPSHEAQFPLVNRVIKSIEKVELLFLAALFHDIAKGQGGDHSLLGERDALEFCNRIQLPMRDGKLVAWLVRQHLTMSMTAQRKDISDPDEIHKFAELVGDQSHLDHLFLLTVADINATNNELWNDWRASLMRQLYLETRRALRRGLENPTGRQELIAERQASAIVLLNDKVSASQCEDIWRDAGDEYFLRETAQTIAGNTEAIANHGDSQEPLIVITETTNREFDGGTQIFIYTPDQDNLFAASASALDSLNLSIQDARIITSGGNMVLNTYIVLDHEGKSLGHDPEIHRKIKQVLLRDLADSNQFPELVKRHTPRQKRHFNTPTQVLLSNDDVDMQAEESSHNGTQYTSMELITADRPGLLARVGRVFLEHEILLHQAKIATLGERVDDVFFITDLQHQPIIGADRLQHLADAIRSVLDEQNGTASHISPSATAY
ncbi:MAG: [protein-PII] uridylyltransferase [Pseudomonadales bacterium]|nr:[protein-PII] uridylyltransferase [Pseudomonadales bacterium]